MVSRLGAKPRQNRAGTVCAMACSLSCLTSRWLGILLIQIEATDHILGSFDAALSDYVMSILKARSDLISVRTLTHIKEVRKGEVELKVR